MVDLTWCCFILTWWYIAWFFQYFQEGAPIWMNPTLNSEFSVYLMEGRDWSPKTGENSHVGFICSFNPNPQTAFWGVGWIHWFQEILSASSNESKWIHGHLYASVQMTSFRYRPFAAWLCTRTFCTSATFWLQASKVRWILPTRTFLQNVLIFAHRQLLGPCTAPVKYSQRLSGLSILRQHLSEGLQPRTLPSK